MALPFATHTVAITGVRAGSGYWSRDDEPAATAVVVAAADVAIVNGNAQRNQDTDGQTDSFTLIGEPDLDIARYDTVTTTDGAVYDVQSVVVRSGPVGSTDLNHLVAQLRLTKGTG